MNKKMNKFPPREVKYSNVSIDAQVVKDFLPRPESLVLREKKKRVTLTLSRNSINFFKKAAKKHKASYQGMIRRLIDYYVANQQQA